jgi:hypothetical protein
LQAAVAQAVTVQAAVAQAAYNLQHLKPSQLPIIM